MTRTLFRIFVIAAAFLLEAASAHAGSDRSPPTWDTWSVGCGNTGLCYTSTFVRGQSTWVDVRVIRDWPANADPLLRITTNTPLTDDGEIRFIVDGKLEDTLPVAELRDIQASVVSPEGFRPIGGEGFWYPTGQATRTLLEKIGKASQLVIELPVSPEKTAVTVELGRLSQALSWVDARQNRIGTASSITSPGPGENKDAPHADAISNPDQIPPAVRSVWDANRSCSDIDPAIFASLDAVSVPLGESSALYILPCGVPSAYNTPYIAIQAKAEGMASQLHLARMAEKGPVATDLIYNAKWNPARLFLEGLFKGSGLGECGTWNRWEWTGSGFVMIEEASRQTCDGKETPLSEWPTTWPAPTSNQ
jgi:hypothetical protein